LGAGGLILILWNIANYQYSLRSMGITVYEECSEREEEALFINTRSHFKSLFFTVFL